MTRRDYELIARVFREVDVNDDEKPGVAVVAHHLADALAQQNPLFNRARFLAACEVD